MADETRQLAVFPLGSVLFPGMPLPLRIFEPRYVAMLRAVLEQPEREFGVVLIERGSEVGGGDVRFGVGTVARIASVQQDEGLIAVLATGTTRFEVVHWLPDDPYPRAEVRELRGLVFDESTAGDLDAAEALVRTTLARVSEFTELPWPPDIELAADPALRIWQVAGIAPLNSFDQYALLRSSTAGELLTRMVEETRAAEALLTAGWGTGDEDDDRPV